MYRCVSLSKFPKDSSRISFVWYALYQISALHTFRLSLSRWFSSKSSHFMLASAFVQMRSCTWGIAAVSLTDFSVEPATTRSFSHNLSLLKHLSVSLKTKHSGRSVASVAHESTDQVGGSSPRHLHSCLKSAPFAYFQPVPAPLAPSKAQRRHRFIMGRNNFYPDFSTHLPYPLMRPCGGNESHYATQIPW